ncbi:MAG TPA: hypothetical protein VKB79_25925 [Bryobacteraceae bacterium]|nr:hypothetical protein [Bryobacteraceae bacterium]
MKNLLRRFVIRTAENPVAWRLYSGCGAASRYLTMVHATAKSAKAAQQQKAIISEVFPDQRILNGPFTGMKYTPSRAVCSSIMPKLLGSYEAELHDALARLVNRQYSAIVDVGCAEGYYAVGLARLLPDIPVYAYDTDADARQMCLELADANGVAERIQLGGFCTAETLGSLPLGNRALIISDCEGYERLLFTPESLSALARHDLLIETHDFIHLGLGLELRRLLERTHQVSSIKSVDDVEKASTYRYEQIQHFDIETKYEILREYRPAIMEWLVAESRT